jgi:hypothetical protein
LQICYGSRVTVRIFRASLALAAALSAAGCFSSSTIVSLRADGSGTIQVEDEDSRLLRTVVGVRLRCR